jgi:hypothetical protein
MTCHEFCLDEVLPAEDHGPSAKEDQKPEAGKLSIVSR